jgi:hypothetical protein
VGERERERETLREVKRMSQNFGPGEVSSLQKYTPEYSMRFVIHVKSDFSQTTENLTKSLGPRAGLDAVVRRKIPSPYRDSKLRPSSS